LRLDRLIFRLINSYFIAIFFAHTGTSVSGLSKITPTKKKCRVYEEAAFDHFVFTDAGEEKMKEIAIKAMKRLTPEEQARVSKAPDELHTE
jgi:hypothetical protein